MPPSPPPSRERIVAAVSEALWPRPFVLALWLEGADAQGHVDDYSDIDLWLDVQDGYEEDTLEGVKAALASLAPTFFEVEVEHPHPHIRQAFFRLQGTSEFLILDLNIQSHSRNSNFTAGDEDEVKVLFDKEGVIKFGPLDRVRFEEALQERIERLEREYGLFQVWVKKELARGRFLEALGNYHTKVLRPLVEALRIRHRPVKQNFHLKDVSRDLPPEVVAALTDLYRIASPSELSEKLACASRLFAETVAELKGVKG